MDQYEIDLYNRKLVELINDMSGFASNGQVLEWLEATPEVAKLCILLYEETDQEKYRDMLLHVANMLDSILVPVISRCSIDQKEKYNILRMRLKNVMKDI